VAVYRKQLKQVMECGNRYRFKADIQKPAAYT
jgi:hypothetical protein